MKANYVIDEQFWELTDNEIFSPLLRRGADVNAAVCDNSGSAAMAVYTCRGWRAPPTKAHEKYPQGLRAFLAVRTTSSYIYFSFTLANDMALLLAKYGTGVFRHSRRVVVESIEILLDHMVGDGAPVISAKKRLVDGLLSVAKVAFPPDVYPDLLIQCLSRAKAHKREKERPRQ